MRTFKTAVLAAIFLLLWGQVSWAGVGYTVKSGDTLYDISVKFGITLDALLTANDLKEDSTLQPGQKLVIPYSKDKKAKQVSSKKTESITYKIKQGDCLDKIAKKYGCSVEDLLQANKLKPSTVLHIDQVLVIPGKAESPKKTDSKSKAAGTEKASKPEKAITETKKEAAPESKTAAKKEEPSDDTKEKSERYKSEVLVDVNADNAKGKNLLDLSQLDDAKITVNDPDDKKAELEKVESEKKDEVPEIVYIVRKGTIAPEDEPKEECTTSEKDKSPSKFKHVVKSGDTVSKLAKKYGVSESAILKANGITGKTKLNIGKTLIIPKKEEASKKEKINHLREPNENLYSRNLASRDRLVRKALQYEGVRYSFGGSSLSKGVDCSGFVLKVYEKFGVRLPHSSRAQSQLGTEVEKQRLLPGDLVFFRTNGRTISHVGIYIGSGKFVHAATSNGKVQVDSLSADYYASRYVTARRIL